MRSPTHTHTHTTTIHIQADVLFVSSHCITTRANLYGQEHTCTHTPKHTHTHTHTTVRRYRQTLYGVRDSSSTASSKRRRRPKREHRNEATVEQSSRVQCRKMEKSNMYPNVNDAPPQYGSPSMIPTENLPNSANITVQQPNVFVNSQCLYLALVRRCQGLKANIGVTSD